MVTQQDAVLIQLGELQIQGFHYEEKVVSSSDDQSERRCIVFDFVIVGGDEYHDITSLLYQPVIEVNVHDHQLRFQAAVHNYFTSVPKLEKDTDTVDVHLELVEVSSSCS